MRKNNKSGGRPRFKPTAALRRTVSIAAGGGMSHEEIALGLGITRNTLEKYFQDELSVGAYKRRLEVVQAMHKAAVKGNVAAQKAYGGFSPAVAIPPAEAEKPKGKKEQDQADALTAQAGTSWEELLNNPKVSPIRKPG